MMSPPGDEVPSDLGIGHGLADEFVDCLVQQALQHRPIRGKVYPREPPHSGRDGRLSQMQRRVPAPDLGDDILRPTFREQSAMCAGRARATAELITPFVARSSDHRQDVARATDSQPIRPI
jgi:hypothetical protein